MTMLRYREQISATNEISKSSTDFTFGGDALQKNFVIFEPGTYKLGIEYQWSHEEKDVLHRVIVNVDSTENTDLRAYQYMGGDQRQGSEKMISSIWTLVDFTVGTFDIDMQFSSNEGGKIAYLNYRRLYVERYD